MFVPWLQEKLFSFVIQSFGLISIHIIYYIHFFIYSSDRSCWFFFVGGGVGGSISLDDKDNGSISVSNECL